MIIPIGKGEGGARSGREPQAGSNCCRKGPLGIGPPPFLLQTLVVVKLADEASRHNEGQACPQ